MAFEWTEKRIQWYLDASRYGNFHKRLADTVAPYLLPEDHLCDLGCGLGLLDLQLAPLVKHITCIDISEQALSSLRREADSARISNLSIRCCDAASVQESFDVALMTFFGYPPQLMFDCMKLSNRLLIRVVNAHARESALCPGKQSDKRETMRDISAALDAAGCSYILLEDSFEFGQPLKSQEDAIAFVKCNSPELSSHTLELFVEKNLTDTGRDDFPHYLPAKKELGIFIIHRHALAYNLQAC